MTDHLSTTQRYLETLLSDKALLSSFIINHKGFMQACRDIVAFEKSSAPPPPLPHADKITALQLAIHDNWGSPTKPKGNKQNPARAQRYGFSLHAWECPPTRVDFAAKNWDHAFMGELMTAEEVKKKAVALTKTEGRKSVANPISNAYLREIVNVANGMPDALFGILKAKPPGHGTIHPEGQLLVFETTTDKVGRLRVTSAILCLVNENTTLTLPSFSMTQSNKQPLSGKTVLQSRYGPARAFAGWRTK